MPSTIQHRKRATAPEKVKHRVVIDKEKCKPDSVSFAYLKRYARSCGKECITVIPDENQKATIHVSETACPACINRCKLSPGDAVSVVKLPSALSTNTTHSFGHNSFRLHGLPLPRPGSILGVLGDNGIGKSVSLNILRGTVKPNLGNNEPPFPSWNDIAKYYRGSDLQNYFTRLLKDELKVVIKPQLDSNFRRRLGNQVVRKMISDRDERGQMEQVCKELQLEQLLDRRVQELSGGELQRVAVACTVCKGADVYIFDEVSSFLDVKQRLHCAKLIRALIESDAQGMSSKYVIVVEHDLAVLDAMSDYVQCVYGVPGAYGIVTPRSRVRNGINQFLAGFLPGQNMKFRDYELTFKQTKADDDQALRSDEKEEEIGVVSYPATTRVHQRVEENGVGPTTSFALHVEAGAIRDGEVVLLLGQNGCGKSTFLSMLARAKEKQRKIKIGKPQLGSVSYKTQHTSPKMGKFKGSVQEYMEQNINKALGDRMFRLLVLKPLGIDTMKDLPVAVLSGGQLQRLAIVICLGTPAACYLIDEPSAALDVEQRIQVGQVVRKWVINHLGRMAFVVEHDLMMAASMADKVIVFQGTPGVECTARAPTSVEDGLNKFLKQLKVTVRQDPINHRPRINKIGSRRDREQKKAGQYYILVDDDDSDGD